MLGIFLLQTSMITKALIRLCFLFVVVFSTMNRDTAQNTPRNITLYQLISTGQVKSFDASCLNFLQCKSISHDVTPCNCDDYCLAMKDCCYERYQNLTTETSPIRGVKCYDKIDSKTRSDIYLISACPDDYDNDVIRHNCEHHAELSAIEKNPVASNRTFLSYRNKYCAMCNGVREGEFDVWTIHFECDTFFKPRNVSFSYLIQSFMDDEGCKYMYEPTNDRYLRKCLPDNSPMFFQSCPDFDSGHLTELCDGYLSLVTIQMNYKLFRIYRNIHCLQCDVTEIAMPDNAILDVYCNIKLLDQKQRLAVTLDFTKFLFGSISKDEERACSEKDIRVDDTGRCVAFFCPDKQVPFFGDCVTDVVVYSHVLALDALFVMNNTMDREPLLNEFHSLVTNMAKRCFGPMTRAADEMHLEIFSGVHPTSRRECSYVKAHFELSSPFFKIDADCPKRVLNDLHYMTSINTVMMYIEQVQGDICFINQTLEPFRFVVHANSLSQSQVGVACPSIQVQEFYNQNETWQTQQVIYKMGSKEIDRDDINATDRGFFICIDLFKSKYYHHILSANGSTSGFVDFGLILSYTGFTLSVVSMLVTVVHYICIPNMTTQHNSILVHFLSLTLFTHIVYVATYFDILCRWAAISLHYLFLVMFFTMTLTLLHIAIHLSKTENPSYTQNTVKMITRFILPGYTLPLMIVMTTVFVNMFLYEGQDWYGSGTNICFLSDPMALFFSFAIPVFIGLVCNIGIFSVTCKTLCSNEISNDNMKIQLDRFWVLVRLSSLVGFSWILGFVGALTGNQIILYAFEGTSSLQGVFLSASLLYNHKVRHWYRNRIGSKKSNNE